MTRHVPARLRDSRMAAARVRWLYWSQVIVDRCRHGVSLFVVRWTKPHHVERSVIVRVVCFGSFPTDEARLRGNAAIPNGIPKRNLRGASARMGSPPPFDD